MLDDDMLAFGGSSRVATLLGRLRWSITTQSVNVMDSLMNRLRVNRDRCKPCQTMHSLSVLSDGLINESDADVQRHRFRSSQLPTFLRLVDFFTVPRNEFQCGFDWCGV